MIRIEVPAPCGWLNSNMRLHRMAAAKLTAQWRAAAKTAAQGHGQLPAPVNITAYIWKARAGRYDAGNLYPTAKACVDGIVDAGLLADDSNEYVIGPDMRHGGKGEPMLVLEFRPIHKVRCPECHVEPNREE